MRSLWSLGIVLAILLAGATESVVAQESFRGMVVDSLTLEALPSVNVQVKNTARGTVTDPSGTFEISAKRTDTLVFSRVGYRTLEIPLIDYEAGMIRLSEQYTLLQAVTIDDYRGRELYEGMFDEENARRENKRLPFWYSKDKKEEIKVSRLHEENLRVKTYVDVVIKNTDVKARLMARHK